MSWLTDLLKDYPALSVAKERLALAEERFRHTEEENKRLKQRLGELEEENKMLRSQVPKPRGNTLEEIEVQILKFLSQTGRDGVQASVVANRLGIHETKAQYYLDRMEETDFVNMSIFFGSPSLYSLGHEGREYLVKNDLV